VSHETEHRVWTAGVLLFSGRPDPTWEIPEDSARALLNDFDSLARAGHKPPAQTRLGYRGVWLASSDGNRWMAFESTAWYVNTGDVRSDRGSLFERAVLSTAPAEVQALIKSVPV
jgi:hypothetical protein